MHRLYRWNAIFDMYDVTRDGFLSAEDLHALYTRFLDVKQAPQDGPLAARVFASMDAYVEALLEMDSNADGQVSRDEFVTFFDRDLARGAGEYLPSGQQLRALRAGYALYDIDDDGVMSFHDYLRCARVFHVGSQDPEVLRAHFERLLAYQGVSDALDYDAFCAHAIHVWCSASEHVPFWFPTSHDAQEVS